MDTDVILMYKVANFLYTSGSTWIPIYLYPYAQIGFNVFGVYLYVNMDRDRCPFSPYVWNKKNQCGVICYAQQNPFMPFFVLLLSICAIYAICAFINTRNYNIDNIKKHCYKLKLYRMKAVGEMLKSELTTTQEEEDL